MMAKRARCPEPRGQRASLAHQHLGANDNGAAGAPGTMPEDEPTCLRIFEVDDLFSRITSELANLNALSEVCKKFKKAMQGRMLVISVKPNQKPKHVLSCLEGMTNPWRITGMHLANTAIEDQGVKRLAVVLKKYRSLAHLDLNGNRIGDEGAGRLAAVLGQCASLAHLKLGCNRIAVD